MTDESYELSEQPQTDDQGHPIHPERGHRICGAVKSDRTTPTEHGRERDDYEYCLLPAGWGTEEDIGACQKHPYGSRFGASNSNFKHGATSEYFKSKLSEHQQDVFDEMAEALGNPTDALEVLRLTAARLIIVGEHSHDSSMIREGRQLLETFNIVPNVDHLNIGSIEEEFMADLRSAHDE